MISVGIDVSKGKSTVCLMRPFGEIVAGPMEISHVDSELKTLVKLIGKETIDLNTYNQSNGMRGNYTKNSQIQGRDLMTPDEVRMLDNQFALLFIRGERPVRDLKYDILKHPNVALTADGDAEPYKHGETDKAKNMIEFSADLAGIVETLEPADGSDDFLLLSEEEIEEKLERGGDAIEETKQA